MPQLSSATLTFVAGLALLAASYVLNEAAQTGLVWLLPCFKAARIRWRELFFLATCVHMTAIVLALGEPGRRASLMPAVLHCLLCCSAPAVLESTAELSPAPWTQPLAGLILTNCPTA